MTEGKVKYADDVEREITVALLDSDMVEVDEYINKNKKSLKLPEAVYAVLSSVAGAYFRGQGR